MKLCIFGIFLTDSEIQNKIINELDDFVYPELDMKFDKHEIFEFCSELKQFYVIITRPKTFLVFYENNLNHSRDGFYRLMESNDAKLIIREDNMNNSQQQFLTNVNNYFREINLIVKTPDELRKLGNDEFNEGHYFRANYLYKTGKNKILTTISEIFYNQETIEEKINYENSNKNELNKLSKKILEDTSYILNEHEEKNLKNIIEKDDNIININDVLEKIIIFKGKSLIILKFYDEAIEFYTKYKKKKEMGMIYLKYKKEYMKAFEIFDSIDNYKFALDSLKCLKDYQKIFNYVNLEKVALYLGIIEYNKIYKNYTNNYFRRYFIIERNKINDKNFIYLIENKLKEDSSNKAIINNFFIIYLNHINSFQIQSRNINIIEANFIDFSEEQLNEIKDDIKLNDDTIHIINAYYFNILKNILIELIKIYPELVICNKKLNNIKNVSKHFKRQLFPNLLLYKGKLNLNHYFETQNKIFDDIGELYKNLDVIIEYLLKNSAYDKDKFIKYIFPFIINNGYFYYKLDKYFSEKADEIKFFFDISLNNYENLWNKNVLTLYEETFLKNRDYLLYYLSYIIRIGITEYIIYKNSYILDDLLFKKYPGFQRLKNLTSSLKDNSTQYKDFEKNIKTFLGYLLYSKEEEIKTEKIIELLDIGSSLSLLLITIYFNNNYRYDLVLSKDSLLELYQNLYKLCNIISSSKYLDKISYNKKMILFSLFSVFNVSPFPIDEKLIDKKVFKLYNYINGCLINFNSILNSDNFFNSENKFGARFFDIFSTNNNDIFEENHFKMFNIEGNNILINYNTITTLFRLILSKIIELSSFHFFSEMDNYLLTPEDIFYNKDPKDTSILFYYHCLNYYIKTKDGKRVKSMDEFFEIINRPFSKANYSFPFMKEFEKYYFFYLNDYFKDLMFHNEANYEILYSFLMNYDYKLKKNNYNAYLLIFLLKEKWNVDFKFKKDYSFVNDSNLYYVKLNIALKHIKECKTNIFISLILLRRIFPKILQLIELYLYNFSNYNKDFISDENMNFKIFSHKYENIWNGIKENKIISELMNVKDKSKEKKKIIKNYFKALKATTKKFSEFGYKYNNKENFLEKYKKFNTNYKLSTKRKICKNKDEK